MIEAFRHLDRLLRGDATRPANLHNGQLDIPAGGLIIVALGLGITYGLCMGVFSLTGSGSHAQLQIVASAIKVPMLFFMTLLVTFPSLYVFSALMGSRLGLVAALRLLVAAIAIMMAVLASLGPIVAFFSLTTISYSFITILNVAVFTLAGLLGGAFLLRTLQKLMYAAEWAALKAATPAPAPDPVPPTLNETANPEAAPTITVPPPILTPPPLPDASYRGTMDPHNRAPAAPDARYVFRIWIIVFGMVGAQMSWIMRPFIGNPAQEFEWFRATDSNFFEAVWHHIQRLF